MLINGELEKLAVSAVSVPIRVPWVGMRRLVLLLGEELLRAALLELAVFATRLLGERQELLRDLDAAHVVAPNLGHDLGLMVRDRRRRILNPARTHVK